MNITRFNSLIALVTVFLTLLSFAPAYSAAAENTSTLSKQDLKVLMKNAKTPAEHQKIAEYYRQKAQQLTVSSKQHSELAATYAKNPPFPALEAKHGYAFGQGATHCRYWAKRDADEAAKVEVFAARHDAMAKAAEQKQGL
jgi:hypothetical protein